MVRYVWLEAMPQQDEWRCAITMCGAQSVMMVGMTMMLEWPADNLDCHSHVSRSTICSIYVFLPFVLAVCILRIMECECHII